MGLSSLSGPKTDVFWDIPFLPSNQGVSKKKVAIGNSTTQKSEKWPKGGRVSDRTDTPRGRETTHCTAVSTREVWREGRPDARSTPLAVNTFYVYVYLCYYLILQRHHQKKLIFLLAIGETFPYQRRNQYIYNLLTRHHLSYLLEHY